MIRRVLLALLLIVPGAAQAANLTCVVPAAEVSAATATCEELRIRMRVLAANWDNDTCATEVLRRGLKAMRREDVGRASRLTVAQAVNDATDLYNANFPVQATVSACGDGAVDAEYGEACDDGVNDGVSCNHDCTLP